MPSRLLPKRRKRKNERRSGKPRKEALTDSPSEARVPVLMDPPVLRNVPADMEALAVQMDHRAGSAALRSAVVTVMWPVMKMNREESISTVRSGCRQSGKVRHRAKQIMMRNNLHLYAENK